MKLLETPEQMIRYQIGDLVVQVAALEHEIAKRDAIIQELQAAKEEKPEGRKPKAVS